MVETLQEIDLLFVEVLDSIIQIYWLSFYCVLGLGSRLDHVVQRGVRVLVRFLRRHVSHYI